MPLTGLLRRPDSSSYIAIAATDDTDVNIRVFEDAGGGRCSSTSSERMGFASAGEAPAVEIAIAGGWCAGSLAG